MFDKCPGADIFRTPTLKIKKCPHCASEIEIFSNERAAKCSACGLMIYNDIQSCIQWCRYAKECLGEKEYNRLIKEKPEKPDSS